MSKLDDTSAEERARLIMQGTIVTAADIIEQIHQAETAATIELAEHLDKTIATAADAVNRMNTAEAEIERQRESNSLLRNDRDDRIEDHEQLQTALEWYAERAEAITRHDKGKSYQEAVYTELALDKGQRARAALAPHKPAGADLTLQGGKPS